MRAVSIRLTKMEEVILNRLGGQMCRHIRCIVREECYSVYYRILPVKGVLSDE